MSEPISSLELEIASNSKGAENGLNALTRTLGKLSTSVKGASKSNRSFTAGLKSLTTSAKKIYTSIKPFVTEINNYVENVNLFTVSMGEFAEEAKEYAETVADIMGVDPSEWMRNQGVFMTLTKGFGSTSERAFAMSQNLTQLGYDLSSFFNIDVADAMQKLQSGISGELEPLRRLGYDLSQARLEAVALSLGIDKSVSSMTQAEKAELRYYAIMTQVTSAQGDLSRTLEQPANQLRILKSQFTQLTRAIGSVFIPILNKVVPYLIAATKVVRELVSAIAALFGFEMPEVDYSSVTSGANGASDALDEATESAKKLKDYTMGFDELNVINPSSGEDSSALTGSGFDFDLPTYDFIGEATSSKVDEIVTKMKEWLGITGEIKSWGDLFETNLGKILLVVGSIGAGFALWKIGKGVASIFGLLGVKAGGLGDIGVPNPKTVLKGFTDIAIIIGGAVVLITAIGALLSIPHFDEFLQTGVKSVTDVFKGLWDIAIPIAAASAYIVVLGKIGVKAVSKGLADMAIIIGGAVAVITAVGALISIPYFSGFVDTGIESTQKVFNGLWDIAIPIAAASSYILALGLIGVSKIATGLADMAIIIGGTVAVVTAVGALMEIPNFSTFLNTGMESLKKTFEGLYDMAVPIGILSAYLVTLGFVSPAVVLSGLAGFALVIGGFEAVLIALGALKQIPGFDWIVGEGGKVLKQLGGIIGDFAGSILGGIAETFSDSLPTIGENLSGFAEKVKPFLTAMSEVDESTLRGAEYLASAVLKFTEAGALDGLTEWCSGDNSMAKFGQELAEFAPKFVEYAEAMEGVNTDVVENTSKAVDSVMAYAKEAPNSGGLAAWFAGDNTLDVIGSTLPGFAANFLTYSQNMAGVDTEIVENTSKAVESVLTYAKNAPNSGGLAAWFAGDNTLDVIGEDLPGFAENFKKYSDNMAGVDSNIVVNTSKAVNSVLTFARNAPNSGGVVAWFTGDNDIGKIGAKLPKFGERFAGYSSYMTRVNADVVTKSSSAAESIIAFASKVPNSGGMVSWFTGDNNLADFGEILSDFGWYFEDYYDEIKNIDCEQLKKCSREIDRIIDFAIRIKDEVETSAINGFANAIGNLSKKIKDLPSSKTITITIKQVNESSVVDTRDSWWEIPAYASGAYDIPTGQMFIAREAGAEMVGSIGNKTTVANNDQIVAGIASGVSEANGEQNALLREQNILLRALLEKEGNVYLDGRKVTETVDRHHRERGRTIMVGGAY